MVGSIFIRRTRTSSRKTGDSYETFRLVEAVREGKASRPEPRQQTIHAALGLKPNPGGTQQTLV